jgi:restriction system protein
MEPALAIPDYQTVMLPLLRLSTGGVIRVPEATDRLADEFGLTESEREQLLPSGRQRVLHNRVHWAKFYLGKAGLITSPRRGIFIATDEGRKLLAQKPARIDVKQLLAIPSFVEFYKREGNPTAEVLPEASAIASYVDDTTPEEQIEAAFATVTKALREDLIARILQNTPAFFEGVIIDLLVAMGYGGSHRNAATQLGRSGDGGVDGVINEDRLGLDRVYVQAKRYGAGSLGRVDEVDSQIG